MCLSSDRSSLLKRAGKVGFRTFPLRASLRTSSCFHKAVNSVRGGWFACYCIYNERGILPVIKSSKPLSNATTEGFLSIGAGHFIYHTSLLDQPQESRVELPKTNGSFAATWF